MDVIPTTSAPTPLPVKVWTQDYLDKSTQFYIGCYAGFGVALMAMQARLDPRLDWD